jgi:hypothetical protein
MFFIVRASNPGAVVGVVVLGAGKRVEAAFANGAVIDVGQAIGGSHLGKIEIRKECRKPENSSTSSCSSKNPTPTT